MTRGISACLAVAALCMPAPAWAAEGDLDPSFGSAGRVVTPVPVGGGASESAMTIDPQGRIIAVGDVSQGDQNMVVARYLPGGAPDPAFDGDGFAIFGFPGGSDDYASAVTVDAQGGILVAGRRSNANPSDFALIRVNDDGSLDTGFGPAGSNGFVTQDGAGNIDRAEEVAVDAQGRIVLGGTSRIGGDNDFSVARFDSAGKVDTTFGNAGEQWVDFTPLGMDDDDAWGMIIDPQGRILLVGESGQGGNQPHFALARLTGDGTRDATFGTDFGSGHVGEVVTPVGSSVNVARAVAIDAEGRILAAGVARVAGVNQFAVVRYNPDGSLDATFSDDGKVTTPIAGLAGGDQAFAVGVDSHGRIVAAGSAGNSLGGSDVAIVRLEPNGDLDPTFGNGGRMTAPNGNGSAAGFDAQERIVVAGTVVPSGGGGAQFGLARFIGDAVAPTATIGSGPADGAVINDATPTFELFSSEADAALACGFDGASSTCASPFTPGAPLLDGAHTFSLIATDRAGNTSPAATQGFTVDTTAPTIEITGKAKVKTRKKRAKDKLAIATSEPAELTCAVDAKAPVPCAPAFTTPKLKRGKHTVTVTATDQVGNSSAESKKIKVVRKR